MSKAILLKGYLKRFIRNPFSLSKIIINKLIVYPIKYKRGNGYKEEDYWKDRFNKYGLNIKGPGHEGASLKENTERYKNVIKIFDDVCLNNINNIKTLSTFEIGVGTGLITEAIKRFGITKYLGVDITDVLFNKLEIKFPSYKFMKADITSEINLINKYDFIVIIDVIEHIVEKNKLINAFNSIDKVLNKNGYLIIAPLTNKTAKNQFYEHLWKLNDLVPISNYKIIESVEWTKDFSKLFLLQKQ